MDNYYKISQWNYGTVDEFSLFLEHINDNIISPPYF